MNRSVIAIIFAFAWCSSSLVQAEECIPVYEHRIVASASHDRWLNDQFYRVLTAIKPLYLFLDIELSPEQLEDIDRGPDEMNRLYFFAGGDDGAAEYLIHLPYSTSEVGVAIEGDRLQGYFVVFEVAGPHGGIMSINLRPFSPTIPRCAT